MPLRSLIEKLREYETALVANTIGFIDPTPAHEWYMGGSIQSVTPGLGPTVGVAVTCKLDTSTPGGAADIGPYWRQLEEMSALAVPVVWVVQCIGSRPDHECLLGDGMAKALFAAGCLGAVTNGGVRDIRGLLTVPLAAYCRGPVIHHGPLRFSGAGEPVEVGGITVRQGDIIHADSEGVIKIPKACLEALPEAAVRMRRAESEVHQVWRRSDISPAEKRGHTGEVFTRLGFGAPAGRSGHELK